MIASHFTLIQWLMALLGALCIGLSKSGLPGIGMVTILLMAEVMPARESTGTVLPLLICGDVFAVLVFQKHAHWQQIRRVLPPALVGIVAGYFLMQRIPGQVFKPVIGWIVLLLALLQFWRKRNPGTFQHIPHTRGFAWLMGGASGVTTMMANAAGPVMTIYLLAVSLPKMEFVGTAAWFFLIINLFKVPFSAHLGLINGSSLTFDLALAPFV
ncbi:MAG: sulfite exporter TauE/SafE family protein, partial [Verrucomicrobiota bacterium]